MKTYESQSSIKPLALDMSSSPTTVYKNYDIKEESIESSIIFKYKVMEYAKEEWNFIKLRGDLDYLYLEMEVTLNETK